MSIRLPRFRRRGGQLPAHTTDSDTVRARLSRGAVCCSRCGGTVYLASGHPDPQAFAWLQSHGCVAPDQPPPTAPKRLWVGYESDVDDTLRWIEERGYRQEPYPSDALDRLRLVRDGYPTLVFYPGVTLVWDGEQLTIERPT